MDIFVGDAQVVGSHMDPRVCPNINSICLDDGSSRSAGPKNGRQTSHAGFTVTLLLPTLILPCPGMHGDWTLIGGFRSSRMLGKVRFVEMTYPRTLTWSLDDHAAAIEEALAQNGISTGWLLGESFGSQPLWAMMGRGKFQAQGVILAGGFVRHDGFYFMRLTEAIVGRLSTKFFVKIVFGYAKFARFRYRRSPETLATLDEFIARRTPEDNQAAQYRNH